MTTAEKLESIRKEVAYDHLKSLECFKGANYFEHLIEYFPKDADIIRHDYYATKRFYDGTLDWFKYIFKLKDIDVVREITCSLENAILRHENDED